MTTSVVKCLQCTNGVAEDYRVVVLIRLVGNESLELRRNATSGARWRKLMRLRD